MIPGVDEQVNVVVDVGEEEIVEKPNVIMAIDVETMV